MARTFKNTGISETITPNVSRRKWKRSLTVNLKCFNTPACELDCGPGLKRKMKYWHEIPQEEVEQRIAEKRTNQYIMDNYAQPDWCNYPDALNGIMGCWALVDNAPGGTRAKISHEFCKNCECNKSKVDEPC